MALQLSKAPRSLITPEVLNSTPDNGAERERERERERDCVIVNILCSDVALLGLFSCCFFTSVLICHAFLITGMQCS